MTDSEAPVTIALRIPGQWAHPGELVERLPADWRLTPESLVMPDGTEIGFGAMDADTQFAGIFRSSCREPATESELAIVDNYTVNVLLSGPGGSRDATRAMMTAAAAILDAGGAGVFIDNCMLAHGADQWRAMTDDGSTDALSFAFVAIVRGKAEVYTMGFHALGLRDIVMKRADIEVGGFDIIEMIRYVACGDDPVEDGHIIADLDGPRFRVATQDRDGQRPGSPMHNPYGRMKLISLRDIAAAN